MNVALSNSSMSDMCKLLENIHDVINFYLISKKENVIVYCSRLLENITKRSRFKCLYSSLKYDE